VVEIRRILCPIDFSEHSRRALDHAAAVARCYGAAITLLHVYAVEPVAAYAPGDVGWPSVALTADDQAALLASMRRFAETEVGTSLPMDYELAMGTPVREILHRAATLPCDMLVMGTHGRSGFEHLVLGSVTEKVLRKAECPVLSVPRGVEPVVPLPPVAFRRILCATDFSDCASNALAYAVSLSDEAKAQLTVLHVIEHPLELPPEVHETVAGGPSSLRDFQRAVEDDRRQQLADAVLLTRRSAGTTETRIATGRSYQEILRVAIDEQSDLIVIGIHGRAAAGLMFFGSTAQHVVRAASCPVLTIRRG